MPTLMMAKCLIGSRIKDSEETVACPDTVTASMGSGNGCSSIGSDKR